MDDYRSSFSFRIGPPPQRWTEVVTTVGLLYGVFVGVPALAGLWAAWEIYRRMHG